MPSRATQKLIYIASAALVVSSVSLNSLPGFDAREPKYMAADNPWSLASTEAEKPEAVESSVYYARCAEARAVGRAPIRIGEAGYRDGLDGDGDGIACEPYR